LVAEYIIKHRIDRQVIRVVFYSGRASYILRDRWYIIVFNEPATNEEKNMDEIDSFSQELEKFFDHFPNYCTKYC
jgi:hypothetical protein